MRLHHLAFAAVVVCSGLAAPALLGGAEAYAGGCTESDTKEVARLRDELRKLAAKNASAGVIRTLSSMIATKCALLPEDYALGGHSARATGDIAKALDWLAKGNATTDVTDLKARFGSVEVKEKAGELTREGGPPFPPDERAAFDAAATALKASGKHTGYLPLGKYTLGAKTFEVKAGAATLKI